MGCGDHDSAIVAVVGGGEIDHFGADGAEVDDIYAGIIEPSRESIVETWAGEADIVSHADGLGIGFICECPANLVGNIFV